MFGIQEWSGVMSYKYRSESQWLWTNVCLDFKNGLDVSHGNFILLAMFVGVLEGVPLETQLSCYNFKVSL
jgi:hypothetical protein